MMQWRVGTFSMGLALVLLGISLLMQAVVDWHIVDAFTLWWPLIFILLGGEIILYLTLRKHKEGFVRYDLFSIFVVIVITTVGIGLVIVTSTGLMDEVRYAVHAQEEVLDLRDVHVELTPDITRVIVSGPRFDRPRIQLSSTELHEVHLFGTMRQRSLQKDELTSSNEPIEIADVHMIGNTAYVSFNPPARKLGIVGDSPLIDIRLILPEQLEVIVNEGTGYIQMDGEIPEAWKLQ